MHRIAIIGAGTSGLFAALVLARDGHDVILLEKDARPSFDANDDTTWDRPGTPQAHLPHGFMALGRALVAEHAPEVLRAVLAAGATDFDLAAYVPQGARDASDDALRVVFCRRPLLESALWDAVERERRIDVRTATTVRHITGAGRVQTTANDLDVTLIIDAAGRRSPVPGWIGGPPPRIEECGMVYYSQYFALRPGAELPRGPWLWGPRLELPYALAIVHLAERGVYSITFGVPTFDAELKILREPSAFAAACGVLPVLAPWADPARSVPTGPVRAMGGLQNVLRPFVVAGEPVAARVIPIADSLCHTNAAYGWGMALGMAHASALTRVLRDGGVDTAARRFHDLVWPEAEARWEQAAQQDRARTARWRGENAGDGAAAAALRALAPAVMLDARVFRAVMRNALLLDDARAILDPALLASATRVIEARGPLPPAASAPAREAFLAATLRAR